MEEQATALNGVSRCRRINIGPALARLIKNIADAEPADGFFDVTDIPPLTDADVAVILRHEPGVLADACAEEAVTEFVAACLAAQIRTPDTRPALIGTSIKSALQMQARQYIFILVRDECERRAAEDAHERATERYYRGSSMTQSERIAHDCGVARLK